MKHKIKVRVAGPNYRKTKYSMFIEDGETILLNGDTPGLGLKHESTTDLNYVLYVDHGCVAIRNEAVSKTLIVNQKEAVQPTLNVGDVLTFGAFSIQFLDVPMVGELNNTEEPPTQLIDPAANSGWDAPAPTIYQKSSIEKKEVVTAEHIAPAPLPKPEKSTPVVTTAPIAVAQEAPVTKSAPVIVRSSASVKSKNPEPEEQSAPMRIGTGSYLKRRSNQLAIAAVASVAIVTFGMYFLTRHQADTVVEQLQIAQEKERTAVRIMEEQKRELEKAREQRAAHAPVVPVQPKAGVPEVQTPIKTVEIKASHDVRRLPTPKLAKNEKVKKEKVKEKPVKIKPAAKPKQDVDKFVHAAALGDVNYINHYVKQGGDVTAKNKNGVPAIVSATKAGKIAAVKSLVLLGADVNSTDKKGMTALMWATMNQNASAVTFLILHGADRKIKNSSGQTAMSFAKSGRSKDIADMLNSGANREIASPQD